MKALPETIPETIPEEVLDEVKEKIFDIVYDQIGNPDMVLDITNVYKANDIDDEYYVVEFIVDAQPFDEIVEHDYYGISSYQKEIYNGVHAKGYANVFWNEEKDDYDYEIIFEQVEKIPYYPEDPF